MLKPHPSIHYPVNSVSYLHVRKAFKLTAGLYLIHHDALLLRSQMLGTLGFLWGVAPTLSLQTSWCQQF